MTIDRVRAARLGKETVEILRQGHYRTPSGRLVDISASQARAVEATESYPPDVPLPRIVPAPGNVPIEVRNETTLMAAQRLAEAGRRVCALNFASATHPGGGFLSGARAPEESLARSSGLYGCLEGHPMYAFHRSRRDALYTTYAIFSPGVPVFRTDEGTLLETPFLCSFITSPAVNARVVLERDPSRHIEIREAMRARIDRVLNVAGLHPHDALILGAWGCGAFGNDSRVIATLFQAALAGPFAGLFGQIVFAITDWSPDRRFIGPFEQALT